MVSRINGFFILAAPDYFGELHVLFQDAHDDEIVYILDARDIMDPDRTIISIISLAAQYGIYIREESAEHGIRVELQIDRSSTENQPELHFLAVAVKVLEYFKAV